MSLKENATEILNVLSRGRYSLGLTEVEFSSQLSAAIQGTRVYSPAEQQELRSKSYPETPPIVEVVDGTTQEVGYRLSQKAPVALLNFASARNVGGGFLNGAKAQEEDLCRCSGLYLCLRDQSEYYTANRQQDSLLYTDYAIFSPSVPFIKIKGTGDFLAAPFYSSVITAPAPNSRPYLQSHPDRKDLLEAAFLRRWENVLCIAQHQRVDQLLLGAWGCGAFGGDPEMASQTAKQAIARFGSGIRRIVFAIPGSGNQSLLNLQTFQKTFSRRSD